MHIWYDLNSFLRRCPPSDLANLRAHIVEPRDVHLDPHQASGASMRILPLVKELSFVTQSAVQRDKCISSISLIMSPTVENIRNTLNRAHE